MHSAPPCTHNPSPYFSINHKAIYRLGTRKGMITLCSPYIPYVQRLFVSMVLASGLGIRFGNAAAHGRRSALSRRTAAYGLPALLAGLPGFFRAELMRGAFFMRRVSALAAGRARLVGGKLVRRPFFMGCFTALARYFTLPAFIHGSKTAPAIAAMVFF